MNKKIIAVAALALLSGCMQNGDGEKIGVVTRIAKEGFFCPTTEVEIMRGGMNNGTGVMGSMFKGTVENGNAEMLSKLKDAMEHQQEVKITFTSEAITFCRSEHNNFIKSVEIATPVGVTRPTPAVITGIVHTTPSASTPTGETRDEKIQRLLATQAELLKELAGPQ